jgi:hypothetical protein
MERLKAGGHIPPSLWRRHEVWARSSDKLSAAMNLEDVAGFDVLDDHYTDREVVTLEVTSAAGPRITFTEESSVFPSDELIAQIMLVVRHKRVR